MRLLLLAAVVFAPVAKAQTAPAPGARPHQHQPGTTAPPPAPRVGDDSRSRATAPPERTVALRRDTEPSVLVSASTRHRDESPASHIDTLLDGATVTARASVVSLPAMASGAGWSARTIWTGPLRPPPHVAGFSPEAEAARPTVTTASRRPIDAAGLRWFAGAVLTPAPLIPRLRTSPGTFSPNFLVLGGVELESRSWRRLRGYATLAGGYGTLSDSPLLRGYGTRRDNWFAMGSGLATVGALIPLTIRPLLLEARAGVGARLTLIDGPWTVWDLSPATELGLSARAGQGRWALVVEARAMRSQFSVQRLPLTRRTSATTSTLTEPWVALGLRRRLGR